MFLLHRSRSVNIAVIGCIMRWNDPIIENLDNIVVKEGEEPLMCLKNTNKPSFDVTAVLDILEMERVAREMLESTKKESVWRDFFRGFM